MYKLLFVFLVLFSYSCTPDAEIKESPIIISGSIDNNEEEELHLRGQDLRAQIAISQEGTFMDTLDSDAGYYTLYHGRDKVTLYLNKGDHIVITSDGADFANSLQFTGDGATIAEYLGGKSALIDSLKGSSTDFYSLDEDNFNKKINDMKKSLESNLEDMIDLDPNFFLLEKQDIHFNQLSYLGNYQSAHRYYADNEDFEETGKFKKLINNEDLDNETNYKSSPSYRNLISSQYEENMYGDEALGTMNEILKLKSPSIKSYLGKTLAYNISPGNEDNQALIDGIGQLVTDEEFKIKLAEKYVKIQSLGAGSPSPEFTNYEDHAGGTKSLSDYKGKYVYVDVWATWCGPCLGEIPSLKKAEEAYHGKNIEFVSISIDKVKDHDKWIKMVNEKELGGSQLMADNAWESKFVTDYVIDGIPRFILIDPDGNIVSGDAPRPSDEKLSEFFKESGI
jgi:thiol-disulfide isomerase/thioredoxin